LLGKKLVRVAGGDGGRAQRSQNSESNMEGKKRDGVTGTLPHKPKGAKIEPKTLKPERYPTETLPTWQKQNSGGRDPTSQTSLQKLAATDDHTGEQGFVAHRGVLQNKNKPKNGVNLGGCGAKEQRGEKRNGR